MRFITKGLSRSLKNNYDHIFGSITVVDGVYPKHSDAVTGMAFPQAEVSEDTMTRQYQLRVLDEDGKLEYKPVWTYEFDLPHAKQEELLEHFNDVIAKPYYRKLR